MKKGGGKRKTAEEPKTGRKGSQGAEDREIRKIGQSRYRRQKKGSRMQGDRAAGEPKTKEKQPRSQRQGDSPNRSAKKTPATQSFQAELPLLRFDGLR